MEVYFAVDHWEHNGNRIAKIKIGQTSDIFRRMSQLANKDGMIVKDWFILPNEFNDLSSALFVESYLRMKFNAWSKQHISFGMKHYGNDYFNYDYRYWGLMEKSIGKCLFNKWVKEAIELLRNNA